MRNPRFVRLVKPILFLTALFLALAVYRWVYYDHVLSTPASRYRDLGALVPALIDKDIMILGSSESVYAFDADRMFDSANIASVSTGYDKLYFELLYLLDQGIRPKLILLESDLASLQDLALDNQWQRIPWNWRHQWTFMRSLGERGNIPLFTRELRQLAPFLGKGSLLLSYICAQMRERFYAEDFAKEKSEKNKPWDSFSTADRGVKAVETAYLHFGMVQSDPDRMDKRLMSYFEGILETAVKHNVRVALVRLPVTREYYTAAQKYIPSIDMFYNKMREISDRFSNVYELDYQKIYFDEPSYFMHANHLNQEGKLHFTSMINPVIRALIGPEGGVTRESS